MNDDEESADDAGEGPGVVVDADGPDTTSGVMASNPRSSNARSALVSLKSLAARYDEAQHKSYLQRLENAVTEPKNRNIALTGRYGTGKSSILEEFEKSHKDSTLRLAISTLGPDTADASLTNRIQKELVKQLVYSASPNTLRHSRFKRIATTSVRRAVCESAVGVGLLGALLGLVGWLPSVAGTGGGQPALAQAGVWALVFVLVVAIVTAVRLLMVDRFFLSNLSAAGASVTLSERTPTYFDEYLDVIVRFFDEESKDIVILEDLDRFNDPHIFEALRELNTLLNNTPRRLKKGIPLRFVYAMRDSLFEKLGADTQQEGDDVASAETVRANRTKFFDIVIPVVPFISHRNARELLTQLIDESGIDGIDRPLVELVGQHTTDMRLLLNIRNEYLVFAERLLESDKSAPGLTPSNLFALVAYKNFHLEDFELISRRSSDLDVLYDRRRNLVRSCVAQRERRKRELAQACVHPRPTAAFATRLGERLHAVGNFARDRIGWQNWEVRFTVDSTQYDAEQAAKPEFWDAVAAVGSITIGATPDPRSTPPQPLGTMNEEYIEALFPEVMKGRWEQRNEDAVREEILQLDQEIDFLRGADFQDLADAPEFAMSNAEIDVTFAEVVNDTVKSALARDLVKQGYIDRNFTLYAAQFYGDFTGVDVATFIVQTVQTNTMEIDYRFTSDGAVANLLAETSDDFTRTVSAYNIQVLDYLLARDDERAADVVNHLISNFGNDAREFLTAYLTSGNQRHRLAARLSRRPWRAVFTYLVSDEGVPADVRVDLVDAALVAADPEGTYDLGSDVTDFVVEHYRAMSAFTVPQEETELRTVVTLLERADVLLPALDGVHDRLRNLVVERDLYELTAPNLRVALGITGAASLDRVRENDGVYQYCLTNLSTYLETVEDDEETRYSVETPGTLAEVLSSAAAENWGDGPLLELIASASPDSSLPRLTAAPKWTWQALAAAKRFLASLGNLEAYRAHIGAIDERLGALLLSAGAISTGQPTSDGEDTDDADAGEAEQPDTAAAAIAILNASSALPSPEDRVQLVRSLDLNGPLTAARINTEQSNLFALLLEHELVADDAATFTHLRGAGWAAVGPAIIASNDVEKFLTPDLVDGVVAQLFENPAAAAKVGTRVLEDLATFLPVDDANALASAAKFAVKTATPVPLEQIRRVATTHKDAPELTLQLLKIASPTIQAAGDIVSVLAELGTPYSHLVTRAQTEFEVPDSDAHKAVFATLSNAQLCSTRKKRGRPWLIVELG